VCFGTSLILRARATGPNPVYYVLGETDAGRTLFCVVIEFPDGKGYPITARDMTDKEEAALRRMEKTMTPKLPTTDSIRELATFWQHHDLTDFEDELEEVSESAFRRKHVVGVPLTEDEHRAISDAAASRGIDESALIREWVKEKLSRR